MSKKETEQLLQVALQFIEGLTNDQFQALINGNAIIRYEPKAQNKEYEQLMERLKACKTSNVETFLKGYKKQELKAFCKYFEININARDTKKVICDNIKNFTHKDNTIESKEEIYHSLSNPWEEISEEIKKCRTVIEAKDYLQSNKKLSLKKELLSFARSQNVYVNQSYRKQEIVNRIVESLVGAKLRGKAIREDM